MKQTDNKIDKKTDHVDRVRITDRRNTKDGEVNRQTDRRTRENN